MCKVSASSVCHFSSPSIGFGLDWTGLVGLDWVGMYWIGLVGLDWIVWIGWLGSKGLDLCASARPG